jgi:hypothetical protein
MSAASQHGPRADVEELLAQRSAASGLEADRLRAALLRGESPESLGLVEDGLAEVLEERGIDW